MARSTPGGFTGLLKSVRGESKNIWQLGSPIFLDLSKSPQSSCKFGKKKTGVFLLQQRALLGGKICGFEGCFQSWLRVVLLFG